MPEYIEREKIYELIGQTGVARVHVSDIDVIPCADVAPVRHGQWNADETCPFCGKKSTEGLDAEKWGYWFPNFCPNCGCRMDLHEGDTHDT